MAATTNNSQYGFLDQLGAMLGMGDNGMSSPLSTGMTVPTTPNTSANWTPPAVTGSNVAGAGSNLGAGTGLGFNVGTGGIAIQGLSSLADIWSAMQQQKLAKEQFGFQKEVTNTNLNNSIKSYNTALEDRFGSRGVAEGRSDEYTRDKIAQNRLSR